jgi:thioredoxin 2
MASGKESYVVKCPSCGASNRVPAKMAGKSGRCGECHGVLPVLYLTPLVLGDDSFSKFLQGFSGPVIAEFWAPW